jgi:hypothetical protein
VSRTVHQGPYADSADAAITAALDEVKVTRGEYVECWYSQGLRLEPVDETQETAIAVELFYSEGREQYKATLRKVFTSGMTAGEWEIPA